MKPKFVNIPLGLLHREKANKHSLELLAMSIIIKHNYGDSLMPNVTARGIAELMHCGMTKAKELFEAAKHSVLFRYNDATGGLLAKNFKKKYTKCGVNRKGRGYFSLFAVKLDNREYSLRGLLKELRKLLLLNLVNGYERKDKFNYNGVFNTDRTNLFVPEVALTEEWIAKYVGVNHRNTVHRLVKELEAEGRLKVTHSKMKFLSACSSDEAMQGVMVAPHNVVLQDRKTGFLYTIEANWYTILATADKRRFTNIIFDNAKRLGKGRCNYQKQDDFDVIFG
ncbi:MAG: hypothetical protein IKW22_05865 [Bacteroidaceae bacterium]|nr:hypothetical protein [Bacteroidaceae bacterium]